MTRHSLGYARRTPPRRGITLIEMLVSITVMSALLVVCVTTMVRLMQAQSTGARALASSLSVGRLSRDFRRDAHAAARVEAGRDAAGASQLRFLHDDGVAVAYVAAAAVVERTSTRPDQSPQRESYLLDGTAIRFEVLLDGRLAAVVLERRAAEGPSPTAARPLEVTPPVTTRIEAAVGHQRNAAAEGMQ